MKAVIYKKYGSPDVLSLEEVATPTPQDDEVLIKVHAVSLNRTDWEMLRGWPLYSRSGGLLRPGRQILGSDIAGVVVATGKNHRQLSVGDEVFGDILGRMGGFAEYVCVKSTLLAPKPPGLTFEAASTLPQTAVIALQGVRRRGSSLAGRQVLINGAGGATGMFAIQLAKLDGAEVTGVDNAGKLDFMCQMGADHALDYTTDDFARSGKHYDLILDLMAHGSPGAKANALKPGGSYFVVGGSVRTILQALILGPAIKKGSGKNVQVLAVRPNLEDMLHVAELVLEGKVSPHVHQYCSLSEVPDALLQLGEGHVKGKIVVRPGA